MRFIRDLHCLNHFTAPRQGQLGSSGLNDRVALVSIWRERFVPNLESDFSKLIKRKEPLQFLKVPSLGIRRSLERLTRRLKVPGELKFITAFPLLPPLPWLFAIIAETRFFWFCV